MEVEKVKGLPRPQISNFKSYREYLSAFFEFKQSLRSGFSFRRFAALVGLKSPNYLQLVIQGQRNLSPATAQALCEALKLSSAETHYFMALVQVESARTSSDSMKAEKELFRALKGLSAKFLDQTEFKILSQWYNLVIRELSFLPDFEPSAEWITEKIGHKITLQQAEEALQFLIEAGYLIFKDGRYQASDPVLDTGVTIFHHPLMAEYHSKNLRMWSDQLSQGGLGGKRQEIGLLNIPMPSSKMDELKAKIRAFQDEIIGWAQDFKDPEEIVQLGTYAMIVIEKSED